MSHLSICPPSPLRVLLAVVVGFLASSAHFCWAEDSPVKFERQRIDGLFRSEGAAVGDFNKDGEKDIAAGYVWYQGPEFKEMHCIIAAPPEHDPKGYSHSFCTWADDLNGDGWDDILVTDFPGTPTWWFENPKGEKGHPHPGDQQRKPHLSGFRRRWQTRVDLWHCSQHGRIGRARSADGHHSPR